jgi:hypothetical protein
VIDAFCDCEANVWRCRIVDAAVGTLQEFWYPNKSLYETIIEAQTTKDCARLKRLELWIDTNIKSAGKMNGEAAFPQAYQLHEDVHANALAAAYPIAYEEMRTIIDGLQVPLANISTAAEAKLHFEHRPEFGHAIVAFYTKVNELVAENAAHRPPGPFLDAHRRALQPTLDYVRRVISQICK